jgi:hypothetical protein
MVRIERKINGRIRGNKKMNRLEEGNKLRNIKKKFLICYYSLFAFLKHILVFRLTFF